MKRIIVWSHSRLDGMELKWTNFPKVVLIGPVATKKKVILPDGDTRLKHGDILIILRTEKDLEINFL